MIRSRHLPAFVLVFTGLLAVPAIGQDKDADFKEALRARNEALGGAKSKWPVVVTRMRQAIAGDPKEATRDVTYRRTGLGLVAQSEHYLPHFFLGEASYALGDCAGALEAWAVSEQQGIINSSKQQFRRSLDSGKRACESKGVLAWPKFDDVKLVTGQVVTRVSETAARVVAAGEAHPALWSRSRFETYERARRDVQASQDALKEAERSRASKSFTLAATLAEKALAELTSVEKALSEDIAAVDAMVNEATAQARRAANAAREISGMGLILADVLETSRQQALNQLNQVQQFIDRLPSEGTLENATRMASLARTAAQALTQVLDNVRQVFSLQISKAKDDATSAVSGAESAWRALSAKLSGGGDPDTEQFLKQAQRQFSRLRSELAAADGKRDIEAMVRISATSNGLAMRLRELASESLHRLRGISLALEDGVRMFLRGDYRQALDALSLAPVESSAWTAHVHLFKAAALFEMNGLAAAQQGQTSGSPSARFVEEVQRCKAIAPTFEPDRRAFSPRFIQAFKQVVAPATP